MNVSYNDKTDCLYLRLDDRQQKLTNQRVTEDIVLDVGANGKIVGIEILDASKHLDISQVFPISYGKLKKTA